MPHHRKSVKPDTPNKKASLAKPAEIPDFSTRRPGSNLALLPDIPISDERSEYGVGTEVSRWTDHLADQMLTGDLEDESECGACTQLLKGSITQFMTSEKFLEKYPERIEGFNLYDYTSNGYIKSEDLGSALAAVGYIVSPNELATVCEHLHIDQTRSMRVDFRLFTAVIAHQIMACSDTQIMDAFRMFDKEGRGTIAKAIMATSKTVKLVKIPGLLRYHEGLKLQQRLWNLSKNHRLNYLIMCEHIPVYTFGKRQSKSDLSGEFQRLQGAGAECYATPRGGLTTFHGPGQLVCYPVLNLRNFKHGAKWYVNQLEELVISTCFQIGVRAERCEHVGIWTGNNKICALGVNIRARCTTHGLALNCCTDLEWFDKIVPCGIAGRGVTSLSRETGREVSVEEVGEVLVREFQKVMECSVVT